MQCWCCPLAATECCPPVRVTPEDPAPTKGVPPREGVPTRSEGRVPAAAGGRCVLCTCSPCQRSGCLAHPRRPRSPDFLTPAQGCGLTRLFPEGHGARTHREPTRPETRTHFANPLFANPLSANPREPTANPPVSRTHLANPREPTANPLWCFPCEPTCKWVREKWVRTEVGSRKSGFESRQSRTHLASVSKWVRST